jgi:hypothetical protein
VLGAFGAGPLSVGQRGDGVELGLVLFAEGVAFAGGVGADLVCFGAGVRFGLAGADGLGFGAASCSGCVVAVAGAAVCLGAGRGDLSGCAGLGGADPVSRVRGGLLCRRRAGTGLGAGSFGVGLGGTGVLARRVECLGQGLGLGSCLGGAGLGGNGGCLGTAARGLGVGDLRADTGRVQAGRLLAGGAGERGGLADERVEGGEGVSGAVRWLLRRSGGKTGVVMIAAGAVVAAEHPCPAAVLDGRDVPAARPLAGAGHAIAVAGGGGIAGHDGTFREQSCFSFHFSSDQK